MSHWVVTRKSDGAEVYRYQHDFPIEWSGMEFATHDHLEEAELVTEPAPAGVKVWTPIDFLRRFTPQERINIRAAAQVSPELDDFMFLLQAAQEVRSDNADVIAGLTLLTQAGLLAAGRKQEILHG